MCGVFDLPLGVLNRNCGKKNNPRSETFWPFQRNGTIICAKSPVVYLVLYNQTLDRSYRHPATFAYVTPAGIKITHCVVWCRIQHAKSQACNANKRLKGLSDFQCLCCATRCRNIKCSLTDMCWLLGCNKVTGLLPPRRNKQEIACQRVASSFVTSRWLESPGTRSVCCRSNSFARLCSSAADRRSARLKCMELMPNVGQGYKSRLNSPVADRALISQRSPLDRYFQYLAAVSLISGGFIRAPFSRKHRLVVYDLRPRFRCLA